MRYIISILLILAIGLGCTAVPSPRSPARTTKAPEPAQVPEQLRLSVVGTCPVSQQKARLPSQVSGEIAPIIIALVAAILPKLVEKGIDLAGSALSKASAKDSTAKQETASVGLEAFYSLTEKNLRVPDKRFGCLVASIGRAAAPNPASTEWTERAGLRAAPSLYFEANVEYSADYTAFRLVPDYLVYSRYLRPGTGPRDLAFSYDFKVPGGGAFATASFVFRGLGEGVEMKQADLLASTTAWLPLRPLTDSEKEAFANLDTLIGLTQPSGDQKKAIERGHERFETHGPTNVVLTVTETGDYNKLLSTAGELLTANREAIATAISANLTIPTAERRVEEAKSSLTALKGLASAIAAVEAKQRLVNTLRNATPKDEAAIATAQAELIALEYDANIQAIGAGVAPPYVIAKPQPPAQPISPGSRAPVRPKKK